MCATPHHKSVIPVTQQSLSMQKPQSNAAGEIAEPRRVNGSHLVDQDPGGRAIQKLRLA